MKNSAWYSKLWLKKLEDVPLKEDADSAWEDMHTLLNKQMPLNAPGTGKGGSSLGVNLIKVMTYVLPGAVILAAAIYFLKRTDAPKIPEAKKIQKSIILPDSLTSGSSASVPGTLTDTVKAQGSTDLRTVRDPEKATTTYTEKSAALTVSSRENSKGRYQSAVFIAQQPDSALSPLSYQFRLLNSQIRDSDFISVIPFADGLAKFLAKRNEDMNTGRMLKNNNLPVDENLPGRSALSSEKAPGNAAKLKDRKPKLPRIKKLKDKDSVLLNYGIAANTRLTNGELSYGFGLFADYPLNQVIRLGLAARLNTTRSFSGIYTHKNFEEPDSLPSFQFTDSRNLTVLDIPLNLEYRLSNVIGVQAGPMVSIPIRHFGVKLTSVSINLDSTSHREELLRDLNQTKVNKVNLGFGLGLNVHFGRFGLNTRYEYLKFYSFSNALGAYSQSYQGIQVGIAYRFK